MTYLLDVNVLIALGLSSHEFHERVEAWLTALDLPTDRLATCGSRNSHSRIVPQLPDLGVDLGQAKELLRRLKRQRRVPPHRSMAAEGWIAQLLRAYRDYRGMCDDPAYWAPTESRDTEVDFLLRRGRERVAIEVKASRRWKPEFLKGLRAIAALPGIKRLRPEKGIEALPLTAFRAELERELG